MDEASSAAKALATIAILVAAGAAGFYVGSLLPGLGGPVTHAEQGIARAYMSLLITGPAGALAGAGVAGFFTWRRWRQSKWQVLGLLAMACIVGALSMLNAIGFI